MERLNGLDALRGIAALLVVAQHLCSMLFLGGHQFAADLITQFNFGKFGVALFFLISGYLVPYSLKGSLRDFALSRAARLLPALWVSVLLVVVIQTVAWERYEMPGTVIANLLMVARPTGHELLSLPYWTLEWELLFYLLVAAFYLAGVLRSPHVLGACGCFAIIAGFYFEEAMFVGFMFGGTLLRLATRSGLTWAGALICLLAVFTALSSRNLGWLIAIWSAIPAFLVSLRWECPARPFLWLGAISYSLYLFHPTMLAVARVVSPATSPALYAVAAVALSIAAAAAAYRYIERPAIAAGKKLRQRHEAFAA